jgi:hypothetical protein
VRDDRKRAPARNFFLNRFHGSTASVDSKLPKKVRPGISQGICVSFICGCRRGNSTANAISMWLDGAGECRVCLKAPTRATVVPFCQDLHRRERYMNCRAT